MNDEPRTVFTDLQGRGHDEDFEPIAAREPTDAPAGTSWKIEVLRQRVERGESLWHPGDSTQMVEPKVEKSRTLEKREIRIYRVIVGRCVAD